MERPAEHQAPAAVPLRCVLVHFTVGTRQEAALFRTDTPDDQLKGNTYTPYTLSSSQLLLNMTANSRKVLVTNNSKNIYMIFLQKYRSTIFSNNLMCRYLTEKIKLIYFSSCMCALAKDIIAGNEHIFSEISWKNYNMMFEHTLLVTTIYCRF